MTQKQLEDYLWGAANILRGMIDAADFKQYIFPLLFFKRVSDIWDEEFEAGLKLSAGDMDYAKFRENHISETLLKKRSGNIYCLKSAASIIPLRMFAAPHR